MSQEITRQIQVPFTAEQMYALVNDVAAYPKFLPWCDSARVLRVDEFEMDARIGMKLGAFHKSFATRNRNQPGKKIDVSLIDGPFKSLHGYWSFHDQPEGGAIVRLNMQFEFANRLVELAIGSVFREIVRNLIHAFEQRAHAVYGGAESGNRLS